MKKLFVAMKQDFWTAYDEIVTFTGLLRCKLHNSGATAPKVGLEIAQY